MAVHDPLRGLFLRASPRGYRSPLQAVGVHVHVTGGKLSDL
jgi:hypothetical protein